MTKSQELRAKAHEALVALFAFTIRNEIEDDPDHSGPEDAADVLAETTIGHALEKLLTGDWRELLE